MTPTEARQIRDASVSVTTQMDCFNNGSYLTLTDDDGQVTYWGPRWLVVHVWRDEQDHAVATPEACQVEEPWRVGLLRCGECGQEFVVRWGRVQKPRCRLCDNAQRAARQRARRERARTLAGACTMCGAPLSARRSSRKYCSPTCRQRAHRQRHAALG